MLRSCYNQKTHKHGSKQDKCQTHRIRTTKLIASFLDTSLHCLFFSLLPVPSSLQKRRKALNIQNAQDSRDSVLSIRVEYLFSERLSTQRGAYSLIICVCVSCADAVYSLVAVRLSETRSEVSYFYYSAGRPLHFQPC